MTKRACVVGLVGLFVLAGCSSSEPPPAPSTLASSPQASTLLASLRSRFVLSPVALPQRPEGLPSDASEPEPEPRTLFPQGSSEGFDRSGDRLVPRLRIASSVRRPAAVTLPVRADGGFEVKDTTSGMRLGVKLRGTTSVEAEEAEGNVVYRGGYRGQGAVVHRPHAEGTEDFVLLEHEPEDHALVYEVDVRSVAGLRLTSNVLEFLNEGGDPRLRMTAPLAVDAAGKALGLRVSVKGCAVDEKEALPWGREVVRPGAERCEVRVEWEAGVDYPLVVDPAWTSTGSLAAGRRYHTASVLSGDRVLIVGGENDFDATNCSGGYCKQAEVWKDGSFASAGSLLSARSNHTASILSGDRVLIIGSGKQSEMWENGSFSYSGSLVVSRSNHTASVLSGDRVLVIGGSGGDATHCPGSYCKLAEVWENGSFSNAGNLSIGRRDHTASILSDGTVLVVGGDNNIDVANCPGSCCKLAELWANNSFFNVGSLAAGRQDHTAIVLSGDRVLIVGGRNGDSNPNCPSGSCKLAEVWQAGTFTSAGISASQRLHHTASALSKDRVLIAGHFGGIIKSTELWQEGSFIPAGSLSVSRYYHTASVLSGDRVLIAGGGSAETTFCPNAVCNTAELFVPQVIGQKCTGGGECSTGFCSEGVCCDVSCNSPCESCLSSRKADGSPDGTCNPIKADTDPKKACPKKASNNACDLDDLCDGLGACKAVFVPKDTLCGAATCTSDNTGLKGSACDTAGTCQANQTVSCQGFLCSGGSCPSFCFGSANCAPGFSCVNNACVADNPLSNNDSCSFNAQCASGFCSGGLCAEAGAGGAGGAGAGGAGQGGVGGQCAGSEQILVENTLSMADDDAGFGECNNRKAGQDFVAVSTGVVARLVVLLRKVGSPTDAARARIYADAALPEQGQLIATSEPLNAVNIEPPTGPLGKPHTFLFSPASSGLIEAGKRYFLVFERTSSPSCNDFYRTGSTLADTFAPGQGWTQWQSDQNSAWSEKSFPNVDLTFELYGGACGGGSAGTGGGAGSSAGQGGASGTSGQGGASAGAGQGGAGGSLGGAGQGGQGGSAAGASSGQGGQGGVGQSGAGGEAGVSGASGQGASSGAAGSGGVSPSLGLPCSSSSSCGGLTCVDGFCCNEACASPCLACSASKKGTGLDGVCGPVAAGTDPDNECAQGAKYPEDCSADGMCDGQGACRTKASETTACGATVCVQGVVEGELCSGLGVCKTAKGDCAPFKCAESQCARECASNGECVLGAFCNELTKQCEYLKEQGKECAYDGQCKTGHCADGVCCNVSCQGQCESCAQAGSVGQCKPTPAGQQPAGSRQKCNLGTASACHGSCDGGDGTSCKFPGAATVCAPSSCSGGVEQPASVCDATGKCSQPSTKDCGGFACDSTTGVCKTSCSSDDDCLGATCNKATKQCSNQGASCADDFTAKTASGTLVPCKGRCLAGQCQESCSGPADCAKGHTCLNNTCVADIGSGGQGGSTGASAGGTGGVPASPSAAASDEGGCGCSTPGQRTPAHGAAWFLALGLAFSRRRRSRATFARQ